MTISSNPCVWDNEGDILLRSPGDPKPVSAGNDRRSLSSNDTSWGHQVIKCVQSVSTHLLLVPIDFC